MTMDRQMVYWTAHQTAVHSRLRGQLACVPFHSEGFVGASLANLPFASACGTSLAFLAVAAGYDVLACRGLVPETQ